jgi:hypothetical protein
VRNTPYGMISTTGQVAMRGQLPEEVGMTEPDAQDRPGLISGDASSRGNSWMVDSNDEPVRDRPGGG